jgi:hypothetical protein
MADTVYSRALVRAAEVEGSTQALAGLLRVPENTLLRWMAGRAQMPVQAFLRVVEIVSAYERRRPAARQPADAQAQALRFKWGQLEAHCARCDGVEFMQADPTLPVRYINELVCCTCAERVIHGELITRLANDAVRHAKAMTVARRKQQASALAKMAPQPVPAPAPAAADQPARPESKTET